MDKMVRWVRKLVQESETMNEATDAVAVAAMRYLMVPELKTYIDMSKAVDKQQFLITAEEWDRSQPEKKHMFKQQGGYNGRKTYHQQGHRQGQQDSSGSRRTIICFIVASVKGVSGKTRC